MCDRFFKTLSLLGGALGPIVGYAARLYPCHVFRLWKKLLIVDCDRRPGPVYCSSFRHLTTDDAQGLRKSRLDYVNGLGMAFKEAEMETEVEDEGWRLVLCCIRGPSWLTMKLRICYNVYTNI